MTGRDTIPTHGPVLHIPSVTPQGVAQTDRR